MFVYILRAALYAITALQRGPVFWTLLTSNCMWRLTACGRLAAPGQPVSIKAAALAS